MNPCERCYLSLGNSYIPGREKDSTKCVLFIGESLSDLEFKNKEVFTGRNSKLVKQYIDKYRLDRYSHLTNLVKCLTHEDINYYSTKCLPKLIEEIHTVNPSIIVPIGKLVYSKLKDLDNVHMKSIINKPSVYANRIMIPIYSPIYVKRYGNGDEYDKAFQLISDIFSEFSIEYKFLKQRLKL